MSSTSVLRPSRVAVPPSLASANTRPRDRSKPEVQCYPLKLVTTKGHLFVRWEGTGERSNVEATSHGLNRLRPRASSARQNV